MELWSWVPSLVWVLSLAAPVPSAVAASTDTLRPWREYRTIMWVGDRAYQRRDKISLFFQRLRDLHINAAMVYNDGSLEPLLQHQFPYYVENMINRGLCLKFNSNVRNWDLFVTRWAKSRDNAALIRDYCLDDPQWRDWAKSQMRALVQKNRTHQPLAYDIRDELSVTISANPFDYDFSPVALQKFREWLRMQYADLAALNRQWETAFAAWEEVKPFTTDQIKNRMATGEAMPRGHPDWPALQQLKFDPATARREPTRWNFSPWADFRTYMDISLASALDELRAAAHALDPHTPVGIEGTQMPSAFGGYDLWRISQALDWVEPYDIANAREILGSFMPGKLLLTTVGENSAHAASRRLWHLLLLGDRGCIVWWSEDCIAWDRPDYDLTPKARALAPVLKEMTSPLAQLFLRAERQHDPVAVLYSQASIQVDWLLESTADGSSWLRRFSSFEADHNRLVQVRNSWWKAFQDLGYTPQFLSSAQVENGALRNGHWQILALPNALALSDKEAEEIVRFLSGGRRSNRAVLCDGPPGLFDERGKLRAKSPLEHLFPIRPGAYCGVRRDADTGGGQFKAGDIARYAADRLQAAPSTDWLDWIQKNTPHWAPDVTVPLGRQILVRRFRLGNTLLAAFERNVNYQMSEDLTQAGGNQDLETPIDLEARFAQTSHVYDLRDRKYLGLTNRVIVRLDPWRPSLFALLESRIPPETVVETLLKETQAKP